VYTAKAAVHRVSRGNEKLATIEAAYHNTNELWRIDGSLPGNTEPILECYFAPAPTLLAPALDSRPREPNQLTWASDQVASLYPPRSLGGA